MEYFLEEKIGDPELFTGRKKELSFFLKWIDDIKYRKSKSTAIMARRKMGKTAILERLFNITFIGKSGIIPFYFEVKEGKKWVMDFSRDFFLTFIYQYIAYKTRKREYLILLNRENYEVAKEISRKEDLSYLVDFIRGVEDADKNGSVDSMWEMVRNAPRYVAELKREFIIQIIDEFQFMNSEIYWDKEKTNRTDDLAGSYLNTAESKIAPLLVSGSWVGWLLNELIMQLPARFKFNFLKNLPEDEAIEMISKYSRFFNIPISEEIVYVLYELSEGSPFYISSIIRSTCGDKDLTTIDGVLKVMEYETFRLEGEIKSTWMEYVSSAFYRVNDRNAKNIVLYLCKNRDREVTRRELLEKLNLEMTDRELERKMKALVMADIVEQGRSNFDYKGVKDNIFDKVFRGVYQREIELFDVSEITNEYKSMFTELKKRYNKLMGEYNYEKGMFAEYRIIDKLRFTAYKENEHYKEITENLPKDFDFVEYERVWKYAAAPDIAREVNIDIYAKPKNRGYFVIGEVKNRTTQKFSREEAEKLLEKAAQVREMENISKALCFVFSRPGFTNDAEVYLRDKGIAFSSNEMWLD